MQIHVNSAHSIIVSIQQLLIVKIFVLKIIQYGLNQEITVRFSPIALLASFIIHITIRALVVLAIAINALIKTHALNVDVLIFKFKKDNVYTVVL